MTTDDEAKLILDPTTFNSPERMQCQLQFENSFGDLLKLVFDAVDIRREGPSEKLTRQDGTMVFPDQVMQFMLWVQVKRDDPEIQLEDLDGYRWGDLVSARLRDILGKAREAGNERSTNSSSEPASVGSSPD